jgi:2-phospho-L-lactate/phosphoenolpyruvate guanylyltransferase
MPVTAIVPLKALADAKGRMTGHLDEDARRALVTWMLDQVLDACLRAEAVNRIVVIAGDAQAAAEAIRPGVEAVVEPAAGLAAAFATADRAAREAEATLVIPADLPLATAADIDTVCAAGARAPAVVVVPTRDGGTGALLRRPSGLVGTAFGPGSAAAHLRLAATAGIRPVQLDLPNLAFDIDTPGDLRALTDRLPPPRRPFR